MITLNGLILIAKYIAAICLVWGVIVAPSYLARQNKKSGIDMIVVRLANWLFWWTGAGWLVALFWGCKK